MALTLSQDQIKKLVAFLKQSSTPVPTAEIVEELKR